MDTCSKAQRVNTPVLHSDGETLCHSPRPIAALEDDVMRKEGCAADAAELLYPRSSRHRAKEREVKKRIPGREKETERKRGGR